MSLSLHAKLDIYWRTDLVAPCKLIPLEIAISLILLVLVCLKIYEFSSNPNTTLSTKINPIVWYILACVVSNLFGTLILSLNVIIFYRDYQEQVFLRWLSFVVLEGTGFVMLYVTRKSLVHFTKFRILSYIFWGLKTALVIQFLTLGPKWYLTWAVLFS